MKIGIGSYTYTWSIGIPNHKPKKPMTVIDLLKKAEELAVEVVQICDNLPLHVLSTSSLDALHNYAKVSGIAIEVGTRGIRPDHLLTYLSLANRLGSPLVRVVTDTEEDKPSEKEIVELIRTVLPEYERLNIAIAIENHDRFSVNSLVQLIEKINSPYVGVCLDTVNSFGALEGPEVVIRKLAPFAFSIHVKDFEIRRANHQMGFVIEGRPVGKGRLDVPWLLKQIRSAGLDPNLIIELWTPPEDNLEATLIKEDRWARESVEYLRQLKMATDNMRMSKYRD